MIYAVDFDGTLVEDVFPEIGSPIEGRIALVKLLKQQGHRIILWTCRCGKSLDEAVAFCQKQGINFDAVNENLPEIQEKWNNDTRKVFADFYLDDKNIDWQDIFREVMLNKKSPSL